MPAGSPVSTVEDAILELIAGSRERLDEVAEPRPVEAVVEQILDEDDGSRSTADLAAPLTTPGAATILAETS